MRHFTTALLAAATFCIGQEAAAEDHPVVVELFTSQGCSACPPADALLGELAGREDVIALGLHVDYWDYIGWPDLFADPAHTQRQKAYAYANGKRMIYTPQMVIGGKHHVLGNEPVEVMDIIRAHQEAAAPVELDVSRRDDTLAIRARGTGDVAGPVTIQLVRFDPHERVAIGRGENAGHVLDYANVVTSWERVGVWDGRSPLALELDVKGEAPLAVILQEQGPGPILAAAKIQD